MEASLNVRNHVSANETVRVFNNSLLEWTTHVAPWAPAVLWLPMISYFYWRGIAVDHLALSKVVQVSLVAILAWTLSEYLIHRFFFHWKSDRAWVKKLTWMFHGIHHDLPNDRTRLLMPPAGSLILGAVFYALFRLVLGPVWVNPGFAGFCLGYLIYDYTHYLTHFSNPRTRFGNFLKKSHMQHHYVSSEIYLGVSSPLWDYLFGTTVDPTELHYVQVEYPEPHAHRTRQIVAKYPQIRKLFGPTPSTAFVVAGLVGLQIGVSLLVGGVPWWGVLLAGYTIGAVADHALFVMIHECSHNLVFRKPWLNRIVSIIANLPIIFPSAISFRNYHLAHHRYQGDVEFDADLAVPGEARLIGNSFFGKAFWMMFFCLFQTFRVSAVKKVKFMDRWVVLNWIAEVAFLAAWVHFFGWAAFAYFAVSSVFSVGLHPLGARWIQEHFLTNGTQETSSYYGPLNTVAFNVGYHNEHHDVMNVAWSRLPQIKAMAPEFYENLHAHRSWTGLFFRFLFDPRLSLYSRVIR